MGVLQHPYIYTIPRVKYGDHGDENYTTIGEKEAIFEENKRLKEEVISLKKEVQKKESDVEQMKNQSYSSLGSLETEGVVGSEVMKAREMQKKTQTSGDLVMQLRKQLSLVDEEKRRLELMLSAGGVEHELAALQQEGTKKVEAIMELMSQRDKFEDVETAMILYREHSSTASIFEKYAKLQVYVWFPLWGGCDFVQAHAGGECPAGYQQGEGVVQSDRAHFYDDRDGETEEREREFELVRITTVAHPALL